MCSATLTMVRCNIRMLLLRVREETGVHDYNRARPQHHQNERYHAYVYEPTRTPVSTLIR